MKPIKVIYALPKEEGLFVFALEDETLLTEAEKKMERVEMADQIRYHSKGALLFWDKTRGVKRAIDWQTITQVRVHKIKRPPGRPKKLNQND